VVRAADAATDKNTPTRLIDDGNSRPGHFIASCEAAQAREILEADPCAWFLYDRYSLRRWKPADLTGELRPHGDETSIKAMGPMPLFTLTPSQKLFDTPRQSAPLVCLHLHNNNSFR